MLADRFQICRMYWKISGRICLIKLARRDRWHFQGHCVSSLRGLPQASRPRVQFKLRVSPDMITIVQHLRPRLRQPARKPQAATHAACSPMRPNGKASSQASIFCCRAASLYLKNAQKPCGGWRQPHTHTHTYTYTHMCICICICM